MATQEPLWPEGNDIFRAMGQNLQNGSVSRIARLQRSPEETDRSLIFLRDANVTCTFDIVENYELILCLIRTGMDDVWTRQKCLTNVFVKLDELHMFALSSQASKASQQQWAKIQANRLSRLYAFFLRLPSRDSQRP